MKVTIATLALALAPVPALAEIMQVESANDVTATADALASAVESAGATVIARVDHGKGAMSVDADIGASQLLIFGNPAIGTPAMEADRLAGLYLPLKVLVYEDRDGKTWLAYENPQGMFDGLNIDADAEFIGRMSGALGNLTSKVAGN